MRRAWRSLLVAVLAARFLAADPVVPCTTALVAPPSVVSSLSELATWAARYRTDSHGQWGFLEWPMALECLSELSPALREALLDIGPCEGPDCREAAKEKAFRYGISATEVAPLAAFLDRVVAESYVHRRPPWEVIRLQLEEQERVPSEARERIRGRMELRFRVHRAAERFAAAHQEHYRARLYGNELHFPDGARRTVTRGFWGRRYVWIPYRDVLRTQEYLNHGIVAAYSKDSWLGFWGFEGYLAPDGRVEIVDQHHRTTAYARKHCRPGTDCGDTLIPFQLENPQDGWIYKTLTHWSILTSAHQVPNAYHSLRWKRDAEWSFLGPAERERLIQASESEEKYAAIRDWYYASTGLKDLAPTAKK